MNIVFIGAGNLATNLAHALKDKGYNIDQVYSRTEGSAKSLANSIGADYTTSVEAIKPASGIYFVALKDDVIEKVLDQLYIEKGLLVHTAGSTPMKILDPYSKNYGVFYPLQTFSKHRLVQFDKIPICLEANSTANYKLLESVAKHLSEEVHGLSSEQRLYLHIAAVMACNFTNFMFAGAETILKKQDIPFHLLHPLIQETVEKIKSNSPVISQTGPAVREDHKTIEKHLNLLSDSELFQNLYRFVSEAIIQFYKDNERN